MSKGLFVGAANTAQKAKSIYIGVDGIARKVKKAYIGVNGTARLFYEETSTPPVGDTVTVTITGYGDPDYCYVKIGGVMYTDPTTLSVPAGTTLEAYSTGVYRGTVTLDGTAVSTGKPAEYTMSVDGPLSVDLVFDSTMFTGVEITNA